jgi:hypothetical protein
MSNTSRVFKTKGNKITQKYKAGKHNGIDLVGTNSTIDDVIAHSDGYVVAVRKDCNATYKTGSSYGNYVKIKHDNGYYTLSAHLKYGSVKVKVGDRVKKGQVIGRMGNTGHSFGAHLHWEVRNTKDTKIDPTPYINSDLPVNTEYKTGTYQTLYNMYVRVAAHKEARAKKKKELTKDGQKHATLQGLYKKGTRFTAQKIISNKDGSIWAQSPSGFICIKDEKQEYCKKM